MISGRRCSTDLKVVREDAMTRTGDRLMDVNSVAERLGVNVRYMRRLVAERRIPYVKCGRLLRFDPDDVEAWIDAARVTSTSDRGRTA